MVYIIYVIFGILYGCHGFCLLCCRPDQWQYYVGYLDTGYKLVRNKWTPDLDEPTRYYLLFIFRRIFFV